jgi:hypothetical protein
MNLNVAFDFDGVIHKDVSKTDKTGNRHPTIPFNEISKNPFQKIIELIKIYKSLNANIYILTARPSLYRDLIIKSLDIYQIPINKDNIICAGDTGGDKIEYLERLNINHFYDDSIYHFRRIYEAKKQNKLKYLKKLYLTLPEQNKIAEIKIKK